MSESSLAAVVEGLQRRPPGSNLKGTHQSDDLAEGFGIAEAFGYRASKVSASASAKAVRQKLRPPAARAESSIAEMAASIASHAGDLLKTASSGMPLLGQVGAALTTGRLRGIKGAWPHSTMR